MEDRGIRGAHRHHHRRHHATDDRHCPLLDPPRVRAVAAPLDAPATERHPGPADHDSAEEHREPEGARDGAVEQSVGADGDGHEPTEEQRGGDRHGRPASGRDAAIAPRVHGGREEQGSIERVGHHRQGDLAHDMEAAAGLTAEATGSPHTLTTLDQLRGHAQRHRHGHADLVERGRHRLEQALRVGEGVGGTDAEQQCGEPKPVVDRREHALGRHRAPEADARHGFGERHLRQFKEDVAPVLRVQQDPEHHTDRDHEQAEVHVGAEPARPGGIRAASRHDERDHRDDHQQQDRVGGAGGRRRHADGPQPPRARVEGAGQASRRHQAGSSSTPRRRCADRSAATPSPAATITPMTAPTGEPPSEGGSSPDDGATASASRLRASRFGASPSLGGVLGLDQRGARTGGDRAHRRAGGIRRTGARRRRGAVGRARRRTGRRGGRGPGGRRRQRRRRIDPWFDLVAERPALDAPRRRDAAAGARRAVGPVAASRSVPVGPVGVGRRRPLARVGRRFALDAAQEAGEAGGALVGEPRPRRAPRTRCAPAAARNARRSRPRTW